MLPSAGPLSSYIWSRYCVATEDLGSSPGNGEQTLLSFSSWDFHSPGSFDQVEEMMDPCKI